MNLKEGDALREGRERKKETDREREFFLVFFNLACPRAPKRKERNRENLPLALVSQIQFPFLLFLTHARK